MKYLLFMTLFACGPIATSAQKIQGVYCGEIITEKNWFVLEWKDKALVGSLYVTKTQKFNFTGNYNKHSLKGELAFTDNKRIPIEGQRVKNSLTLFFTDSTRKKTCILHRLPEGTTEEDLFSQSNDPDVLGRWETFKETDSYGNDITNGKLMVEFGAKGLGFKQLTGIPNVPRSVGSNASGSPDLSKRSEITWETSDGRLSQTETMLNREVKIAFDYAVRNDTLILKTRTNKLLYWRRK